MHDLRRAQTSKGVWGNIERGVHLLERGVQIAGTLKAGYDAARTIGTFAAPLLL